MITDEQVKWIAKLIAILEDMPDGLHLTHSTGVSMDDGRSVYYINPEKFGKFKEKNNKIT